MGDTKHEYEMVKLLKAFMWSKRIFTLVANAKWEIKGIKVGKHLKIKSKNGLPQDNNHGSQ